MSDKLISAEELVQSGFSIVDPLFDSAIILKLESNLEPLLSTVEAHNGRAYGIRDLLNACPPIREFTEDDRIKSLVEPILGSKAKVVRAIYFDKTPEANWKVAWHQDLTITVKQKIDTDGFAAWSIKGGVVHVQPPISVLENMLTLRIALDDSDEQNGALRVIPGSHRLGRLNDSQILKLRESTPASVCAVQRSGALAMRPLLLHSSSTSRDGRQRRVLHLEFSSNDLPRGLEWYGS